MRALCILSLIVCLAALTGCNMGFWGKRASEEKCPTDVRKTHFWCCGEDAIFRAPCGPTGDFYGHRPTCWRAWPTSGGAWRDLHCGGLAEGMLIAPGAPPSHEELPAQFDAPPYLQPAPTEEEIIPQLWQRRLPEIGASQSAAVVLPDQRTPQPSPDNRRARTASGHGASWEPETVISALQRHMADDAQIMSN